MASVTFTNLSKEQAKELASWYCGQGEQDAGVWFEIKDLETPMTDKITSDKEGNVTVKCRS